MNTTIPPEFIAASIWLWENFSKDLIKSLASSAKKKAEKEWEKFEWSLAAKEYRENIYKIYSTMRILGSPSSVLLEGIYTDVYLLDKPTAYKRHNIDNLRASYSASGYIGELNDKKNDALKLIQKERRLFVLGKPGAGKTTLLKHLTLLAAKGEINKIPIFVSLNDWSQHIQGTISQHDLISYMVSITAQGCEYKNRVI
jgi:hypothetical protein